MPAPRDDRADLLTRAAAARFAIEFLNLDPELGLAAAVWPTPELDELLRLERLRDTAKRRGVGRRPRQAANARA